MIPTPKEKAKELANKFYQTCNCTIAGTSTIFKQIAVQAALISVEEILNTIYNEDFGGHLLDEIRAPDYWQEVKNELLKREAL